MSASNPASAALQLALHGELLRERGDELRLARVLPRPDLRQPLLDAFRRRVGERLAQQRGPRGGVFERGQQLACLPRELRRGDPDAPLAPAGRLEEERERRRRLRPARRQRAPPRLSAAPLSNRSPGSLASARAITASNAEPTTGGGSERCAQSLRSVPSSGNGTIPVSV